jgi:hypothetical protein
MKGKVSSHNFAFSPADTKLSGFVGLFGRETSMLSREISPFGCSAKSKQRISLPGGARLSLDDSKFSHFREALLPLVSRMFGEDQFLPFRGVGQK